MGGGKDGVLEEMVKLENDECVRCVRRPKA